MIHYTDMVNDMDVAFCQTYSFYRYALDVVVFGAICGEFRAWGLNTQREGIVDTIISRLNE